MSVLPSSRPDIGLLLLRLGLGGMMFVFHGWPKLFGSSAGFPDPLGLGSEFSYGFAVFAEAFCALIVVAGPGVLLTRLACLPIITTMLIARFMVYPEDPARAEYLMLYAIGFVVIAIAGPGKYRTLNS